MLLFNSFVCVRYFKVARRWVRPHSIVYTLNLSSVFVCRFWLLIIFFFFFPSLPSHHHCIFTFLHSLVLSTHSFRKFRQDSCIFTRKNERVEYSIFVSSHFLSSFRCGYIHTWYKNLVCVCVCTMHTLPFRFSFGVFVFKAFPIIF